MDRQYFLEDVQIIFLKDIKNCTSVYLYADREFRKNRVKEIYGSNAEIMDKEERTEQIITITTQEIGGRISSNYDFVDQYK